MSRAQTKKDAILADLVKVREEILTEAAALPEEKQYRVFLGVWSVADLLAHLVGWDYTNLEAARQVLAGLVPDFYAHIDRDWKTYNARLVARYKLDNFSDLLASTRNSQKELVDYLQTLPVEEMVKDRGVRARGYRVTIARLLAAEAKDEKIHLEQIRQFASQPEST